MHFFTEEELLWIMDFMVFYGVFTPVLFGLIK